MTIKEKLSPFAIGVFFNSIIYEGTSYYHYWVEDEGISEQLNNSIYNDYPYKIIHDWYLKINKYKLNRLEMESRIYSLLTTPFNLVFLPTGEAISFMQYIRMHYVEDAVFNEVIKEEG